MNRKRLVLLVAALAVAAALVAVAAPRDTKQTTSKAPSRAAAPSYFGAVKSIVDARCTGCHRSGGIAPFALTSYSATKKHSAEMAYVVKNRIMPPWHAARGVRRYLNDPSLTRAQIDTIVRWAHAGAPRGNPATKRPALKTVAPTLTRVDRRIQLPEPYTPKGWLPGGDDYHCFVVPWSADRTQYVTGFNLVPGVRKQVHHMIAFVASPSSAATVDRWDAGDSGPGYRCYGGASAVGASAIPVRLLAGWAPGLMGGDLPRRTGIEIAPGSRLILQFHYNLEHMHGMPMPDRSTLEFEVADSVERRAAMLPVVNVGWLLAPASFAIPPTGKPVVHSWSGDPTAFMRFLGDDIDTSNGLSVEGAILHMHRLGVGGTVTLEHASAATETLLRVPHWDFNWQRAYFFARPLQFNSGDRLSVSCTHRNTTKRLVTWGESSSDEMCIAFVYVAERH